MKSFNKSVIGLLIAAVACLYACGEGLYDDAKRAHDGYPMAAVLVYDSGMARIIITDGVDYFREIGVGTIAAAPTVSMLVHMHRSGDLFIVDNSTVHVNTGNGWMTTVPYASMPVQGFASMHDTVIALVNNKIYEFDRYGSTPWREIRDLTSLSINPTGMRNVDDGGEVYILGGVAGTSFYRYDDLSAPVTPVAGLTIPIQYFNRSGGVYYLGKSTMLGTSEGKMYSPSSGYINDYAVISSTEIYGQGGDGTYPYIFKLDARNNLFIPYHQILSGPATVFMGALEPTSLILGLRDSADNGIFIFDYATKSLRKIYTSAVYGLHVMRR